MIKSFQRTVIRDVNFVDMAHFGAGLAQVHPGFKSHFELGLSFIKTAIDWVGSKITRIVFCGHSLGGAVAQLAFYYFNVIDKLPVLSDCVTIGSPKIGCVNFCREFESISKDCEITRFGRFVRTDEKNMKDDLVTVLPPWLMHALNFQRIKVSSVGISVEDSKKSNSMTTSLETHDADGYFELISRYLNQFEKIN